MATDVVPISTLSYSSSVVLSSAILAEVSVMHLCTRYGLPRPALMRLVMKLLADVYEPRGGQASDRLIAALTRIAPAA